MYEVLSNRHWLLEENYLSRMHALISERMRLGHSIESLVKPQSTADYIERINALLSFADESAAGSMQLAVSNGLPVAKSGNKNVALIPVIGPLTKYSGLCNMGMQQYQSMISQANADPSIDGIVLIMDTPGGTVDGTQELGMAVKNSAKPVGVFGDQMVASAGLWIASQASVIVGNKNNPTSFGSIGTLMVKQDISPVSDSGRMPKTEIIRAPQSTEKSLINSIEPLTDATRGQLMEELKAITDQFINTVKDGRGEKLNTEADGLFKGRMFGAAEAKKIGLIDNTGTLQTAVNKIAEMAREKTKTQSVNGPSSMDHGHQSNMKFPKLSNLFSGEAWSKVAAVFSEEEQATLEATEQKVDNMEAQLSQLTADNTQLTAANTNLQAALTALDATVTEVKAQVSTLEAEKATLTATVAEQKEALAKKPTGSLTTVIADPDKEAAIAGDPQVVAKNFKTKADAEVDEYLKFGKK